MKVIASNCIHQKLIWISSKANREILIGGSDKVQKFAHTEISYSIVAGMMRQALLNVEICG